MIIYNIEGEAFDSFTPAYITLTYKIPTPRVMMTDEWVNKLDLDILECAKKMMIAGRQLRQKETGKYESTSLRPPYRIIALILNRIFCRENVRLYKLSWIPLIYYVAFECTIFN